MRTALRLTAVEPDSAAAKAGLRQGDVLLGADGRVWQDTGDMMSAIDTATTGNRASAWQVHRKGEVLRLEVPPGELGISAEASLVEGLDQLRQRAGLALPAPAPPAAAIAPQAAGASVLRVQVVDFDMPFGSMVGFMVKWAIAAIPALLILTALGLMLVAALGGVVGLGR